MIPSKRGNRCAKRASGKNIPRKELVRSVHPRDSIVDWDLYVYRTSRAPDLPLLGSFYGLEFEDSFTDLKKMEERDREIMAQKHMQEQADCDRLVVMQNLFRENYRHWQRVGYNPPKDIFSSLAKPRTFQGEYQTAGNSTNLLPNLKPQVKRGRSNSDAHMHKFIVVRDESSSCGYEYNGNEEEYEYEYTEEDVDMSVYGRLPEIITDGKIVEAILSSGRNASPSILAKIMDLRRQCVDRFWIEEVKFLDNLSEIVKHSIEDPAEKTKILDMFTARRDVQLKMDHHRSLFDRMLEKVEWDSKETKRKLEQEYTGELERLSDVSHGMKYRKPSSELLNLRERLKRLLFNDEIEQARELEAEITEVEAKDKIVNEARMNTSRRNAERNLKMKYDRKMELHEKHKEYRQQQIRAKEEQELGKYDRVIQRLDEEIQVARRHNQLREREMYSQKLSLHPMRVRATSYFEETGELEIFPPVLRS